MIENTENTLIYDIGSTPASSFQFNIPFFENGDLECYYRPPGGKEIKLTSGTDFTVRQQASYGSGGIVDVTYPVASGGKLAIVRVVPETQTLALPDHGKLPSTALERQLDRTIVMIQQLRYDLSLTVKGDYTGNDITWNKDFNINGSLVVSGGATISGGLTVYGGALLYAEDSRGWAESEQHPRGLVVRRFVSSSGNN